MGAAGLTLCTSLDTGPGICCLTVETPWPPSSLQFWASLPAQLTGEGLDHQSTVAPQHCTYLHITAACQSQGTAPYLALHFSLCLRMKSTPEPQEPDSPPLQPLPDTPYPSHAGLNSSKLASAFLPPPFALLAPGMPFLWLGSFICFQYLCT